MRLKHNYNKKITLYKDMRRYDFSYEVLKELAFFEKNIRDQIKEEVKTFFIKNWEDFGDDFIDHSLFDSTWVLIVRDDQGIAGVATVHKKKLKDKIFYNFKTLALVPKYHSLGLMERMNQLLFKYAYIDNLLREKSLWFHMIFSTPNLRILGFFAKHTKRFYPNPFDYDESTQSIPLPDDETWEYVQAYNQVDFPPNSPLTKEGCVLDDSKSAWPHVCYEKSGYPYHTSKIVNAFGDHYLRYKMGERHMVVVCAHISVGDVVRYFLNYVKRKVQKALVKQ